jgi:prevent-host-death family protein
MITRVSTAEAREQFTELVNRVVHYRERVVLTRRGKEIAAIISTEDFVLLQELRDKIYLQEAMEAFKQARAEGTITLEKLKEEIGL